MSWSLIVKTILVASIGWGVQQILSKAAPWIHRRLANLARYKWLPKINRMAYRWSKTYADPGEVFSTYREQRREIEAVRAEEGVWNALSFAVRIVLFGTAIEMLRYEGNTFARLLRSRPLVAILRLIILVLDIVSVTIKIVLSARPWRRSLLLTLFVVDFGLVLWNSMLVQAYRSGVVNTSFAETAIVCWMFAVVIMIYGLMFQRFFVDIQQLRQSLTQRYEDRINRRS